MSSPIFLTQLREGWHQEVLAYWFGGDAEEAYRTKWFAPRGRREIVDEEVAQKFGHVLSAAQNECFCPNLYLSKATPEQTLALIVVLDQFSRHAYRGNRHKIEQYDLKALPLALEFLSRGWQRQLTASQHAFVLMPLRHQPNRDHLEMVLSEVDRREIWDRQQASVLAKFRRATLKSLQVLLDTSPEDDEILEKPNIACDESDVAAQKLTKTVMDYLAARRERCSSGVIVSLSGGVDSMVLTKILIHARQHSVISCIAACHVDYANRCESKRESEYLKEWCDRNGIAFRMRLVNSVKRGVTAREEYEEVSRKARYDLYKDVMEEFGIPAVLFGHHQGDLQENVISNIMRGAGLFNMAGMTEESVINGVTIWRPLLPHSKDVVYEFAHKYGVPYFKDTTPRWSTRGKLRRSLMPILSDMYGEGFASNLSLIARQSHQAAQWFQRDILGPFKEGVAREPLGFWVDIIPHRGRDSYFWSEALKDLLHSVGLPMLREKGLQWFINRIGESGSPMPTDAWIRLRSEFAARLQGGVLFVFRPDAVPPNDSLHIEEGLTLPLGKQICIGSWTVQASDPLKGKSIKAYTAETPFSSVQEFMKGEFYYWVAVSQEDKVLVFTKSDTRKLAAWKKVDLKIRSAMPLAAPPTPNIFHSLNTQDLLVRVTLKFNTRQ